MKVREKGLVASVFAFESPGTLLSAVFEPPQTEYIDFEPPDYPGGTAPQVPCSETAPARHLPPPDLPPLEQWWQETLKSIQEGARQWWEDTLRNIEDGFDRWLQEQGENLEKRLAEEL